MVCMLAGTTAAKVASPRTIYYRPSAWGKAYATFYGDETARETMGAYKLLCSQYLFYLLSRGNF